MTRILIVDDEESVTRVASAYLEDAGFQIMVASNGAEAMEILERENCDVVLTDLVMPEKEGAETVMDLRRKHPEIGIIAMSGVPGATFYLRAARMLGAQATLTKPFTREQLVDAVNQVHVR